MKDVFALLASLLLLLTCSGCEELDSRQFCDKAIQERVFLECMKALTGNTHHDTPVSACLEAAEQVACTKGAKEKQQ